MNKGGKKSRKKSKRCVARVLLHVLSAPPAPAGLPVSGKLWLYTPLLLLARPLERLSLSLPDFSMRTPPLFSVPICCRKLELL